MKKKEECSEDDRRFFHMDLFTSSELFNGLIKGTIFLLINHASGFGVEIFSYVASKRSLSAYVHLLIQEGEQIQPFV